MRQTQLSLNKGKSNWNARWRYWWSLLEKIFKTKSFFTYLTLHTVNWYNQHTSKTLRTLEALNERSGSNMIMWHWKQYINSKTSITTNKASGGDGIPVELFQILKDDSVKMLHSICQQIWKTQQWTQDWKRSAFIPIPKKGNAKESSNYHTIVLISHASKVMLKILQVRLQQHMNRELPDVQADFRKGRGTKYQIANICWMTAKAREFQKNICFCCIVYAKASDCVDHNKLENSERDLTCLWEICMQIQKQQLELDMEPWTGYKLGKDYVKAVYCHPAYLTYMQSTSWEMPG